MRYHQIICETDDPLETALNLWVEGKMKAAQPLLMQLDDAAQPYQSGVPARLYRGFLPDQQVLETYRRIKQFSLHSNPTTPFSSWSTSRKAVMDFMFGWERPWMLLVKSSSELNVFINLALYDRLAKPFTKMAGQKEVIVRMPPEMLITRANVLAVHDR